MLYKIICFIFILIIPLYGEKEIIYNSKSDFQRCYIINGEIKIIKNLGYGVIFQYKDIPLDDSVDLLLTFNQEQQRKEDTGHYSYKQCNLYFNPNFKFCDSTVAGFIKPDNKLMVGIHSNNFLANDIDLGSFAIDFFIYPVALENTENLVKKGIFLDNRFYGIVISIENRKVKVLFDNFFYSEEGNAYSRKLVSQSDIQLKQWHHIGIIFDRSNGKISLYINGVRETENLPNPEQISDIPHFAKWDGSDLNLFDDFKGYVDNFRIVKTANIDFKSYLNFFNSQMEISSPIIDLGYSASEITDFRFHVRNKDEGIISFYIKQGNKKEDFIKNDWEQIDLEERPNNQLIVGKLRKSHYLQWKIEIERNISSEKIPFLYDIVIKYTENIPPLAPKNIQIERLNQQAIRINWDPNYEEQVLGYIIYWGNEKQRYENKLDIGIKNSYIIDSLNTNKNYYFAIKAYNNKEPYNLSEFSKEVFIFLK